jgi:phosphomevalonate kinase
VTGAGAVSRYAPGKLFIVGEYAVVEPGHPAVLVAVDRQVGVTVSGCEDADVVIESDLYPGQARLRRRPDGLVAEDGQQAPGGLTHAVSAVEAVDRLLAERGLGARPMHISIRSRLHRDGTKFGLGSSGAVTVAVVSAVAAYCGVQLSSQARFRLAMLAAAWRDPGPSGGDLAASVWGGWISYRSPDRAAVLEMAKRRGVRETIRAPWPGFELRRLPPPGGLALEVGWTGRPASTASLTRRLGTRKWRGSASQDGFLARSDACVRASIRALERGDGGELLRQIRTARQVLADLDDEVRLGIFTAELAALCDAAEAVGGAAKPSGAGGGDCGIALLDAAAQGEIARLRERWAAAGVLPMLIHAQPTEGSAQ